MNDLGQVAPPPRQSMMHKMRVSSLNYIRLLRYAGLFTYACVGIPLLWDEVRPVDEAGDPNDRMWWFISYAVFGLAYWIVTRELGTRKPWQLKIPLLLLMNVAAISISYFSQSQLSIILMLVIAGVLPWMIPFWPGFIWVIVQNISLAPVTAMQPIYSHGEPTGEYYGWFVALMQNAIFLGFSSYTYVTSVIARQQADSREEQRRLNSELRATRTLLTESSRIAERMRISRELHDLVGHHLTALSLNLEVASHLAHGASLDHVKQAQSVAKLLLADVREVVSQLRDDDSINLTDALTTLIEGVPGIDIHLELPPRFSVDDPRRAQVLLRCTQEIITNTVRHANARNLWLRFERTAANELALHARDDGRGVTDLRQGNGLLGMHERLAQIGGRLNITTERDHGFTLDAWLPLEATR
jgi:signal transduction histidine kinase